MEWIYPDVPEKGKVEIRGMVKSQEEKEQVLKAIKTVKGVSEVQDHIVIVSRRF